MRSWDGCNARSLGSLSEAFSHWFAVEHLEIFPDDLSVPELIFVWQAGLVASDLVKSEITAAAENEDDERLTILKRGATYFTLAGMHVLLHKRNGATFLNKLTAEVAGSNKTVQRLNQYAVMALEWHVEAMNEFIAAGAEPLSLVRASDTWTKLRSKVESRWRTHSLAKKFIDEALPRF